MFFDAGSFRLRGWQKRPADLPILLQPIVCCNLYDLPRNNIRQHLLVFSNISENLDLPTQAGK